MTLAGYAGRDNNNAVACEDETNVNLFQFIGSGPNPTLFGTWVITSGPAGALNGPSFRSTDRWQKSRSPQYPIYLMPISL